MIPSTRIMGRIVVLALLSLAPLTGSAFAECAWVLWQNDPRPVETKPGFVTYHYQIVEAFTGLGSTMNSMLAQRKCEERKKQLVIALPEKAGTEYVCLPDTIDPRGPKTK